MPNDYLEKYTDRVRAVEPDQIQSAARKYMAPDRSAIVVVGDAAEDRRRGEEVRQRCRHESRAMKINSKKAVYKSKIFTVSEEEATDPSGFKIERAIVRHAGSAVMFAVDDKNRVLLVKQFRLPAEKDLWEIPAGRLDPGEKPLVAAKRELAEETGYTAKKWKKLLSWWPSPGYVSEKMHVFLATDLTKGKATPMEDERIESRWFKKKELDKLIRDGKIEDGKTLIAFLFWQRYK